MADRNNHKPHLRYKINITFLIFVLFSAFAVDNIPASEDQRSSQKLITDFQSADERKNWRIVNDVVMGGISKSEFVILDKSIAMFRGNLSLENNGGFASIRTFPTDYNLSGFDGISISVRGDGKKYQVRLQMGDKFDGLSYKASFKTTPGKWETVPISFTKFTASYRGRFVRDAPALDPGEIRQIGFLIADQQEGPFQLEIDWIKAYKQ
jgi:NADH dehydrogenase [ubiquinone] 1 alpha subcomplex assembly factor 1